jgi:hypothetical protein
LKQKRIGKKQAQRYFLRNFFSFTALGSCSLNFSDFFV